MSLPASSLPSPVSPSREASASLLVAWDFNGVIDSYGLDLASILQAIIDRGGHNIIVSNGSPSAIDFYLKQRQWSDYFDHVYGMDRHHGLVARHKVAALAGHITDKGPFSFVLLVGDNLSDIDDGQEAGAQTCLYDPHQRYAAAEHRADYVIDDLQEVLDLLPL